MAEAAYITLLFAAALAVVGILGEISGFRAIVCSRGNEDFARRVALVVTLYGSVSLLLALLLVRVLNLQSSRTQ